MTFSSLLTDADSRPCSADLLPWADPYIYQLFAEAELVDAMPEEADVASGSWTIKLSPHSPAIRTRRIGSEHWSGHCERLST
jgi:hypothetical protein